MAPSTRTITEQLQEGLLETMEVIVLPLMLSIWVLIQS
ncbi:hypothetical protein LINPERHAP1_LOCUS8384 [Linum perenne]